MRGRVIRAQIMSLLNGRAKYSLIALANLFIIYLIGAASRGGSDFLNSINRFSQGSKITPVAADVNEDVAFCIATKDHPEDLVEFFVHHYHHHGIRRFYVMDDGSSSRLSTFNDYGIPREHVSFHYFDEAAKVISMQTVIYSECIRLYGSKHKWMAFIDADEFVETIKPGETLLTILKEFDPIPTIGAQVSTGVSTPQRASSRRSPQPGNTSPPAPAHQIDRQNGPVRPPTQPAPVQAKERRAHCRRAPGYHRGWHRGQGPNYERPDRAAPLYAQEQRPVRGETEDLAG
ncbi:hypothetical protein V495_02559 [Pseudogymnoascus sp. VKM F-4514 (FW-929)]|nr:hypothetical protein V495_02559 [Pseudogymnoascus sp. VKM F-4514 (FW-929)]KFY55590.1 hypothetical protein V497_06870 [Pseudogymnoascus sp. VKM F-4516 (FW-969)]